MTTNSQHGLAYALVGNSNAMQRVRSLIKGAASTDMNVLILGETGVGKELVARDIYRESRREGNYVTVNCAAIPEGLFESELFGYRKGAFTSADIKGSPGVFQYAERGIVFLDEILDMAPPHQAKLLRFLQEKELSTVGSPEAKQVDVNVITATNHNLEYELSRGNLRHDLYYRLNGFTIDVPPLRERLEDLPALVRHFIVKHNKLRFEIDGITPEAMGIFTQHSWPGNVRELENYVRGALVEYEIRHSFDMGQAPNLLGGEYFKTFISNNYQSTAGTKNPMLQASSLGIAGNLAKREAETILIRQVLEQTDWNRVKAAKILEISYRALMYKMRAYDIRLHK